MPEPRRGRPKKVPTGMPVVEDARGAEREQLSVWMKARIAEVDREHLERIELLRTVGEHPSPLFQKVVMNMGGLGMPKALLAKMLGLTVATLETNYGDDYALGKAYMIKAVASNAVRIGTSHTDPNAARVAMQILDRHGGEEWKPPAQKVITEDDRDKPPTIDSSKLTFEQRAQLRAMLQAVVDGQTGDPVSADEDSGVIE
jgi:hypothetical protein